MTASVRVSIAVVEHERRYLVGRRGAGQVLEGYWEFPGGKRREGESAEEAAARECFEETGLEVCVQHRLCACTHQYEHARVELQFFACRLVEPIGVPRKPFRWLPLAELRDDRFPPANAPLLAQLRADSKSL